MFVPNADIILDKRRNKMKSCCKCARFGEHLNGGHCYKFGISMSPEKKLEQVTLLFIGVVLTRGKRS